jgi:hypothetical protein
VRGGKEGGQGHRVDGGAVDDVPVALANSITYKRFSLSRSLAFSFFNSLKIEAI